MESSETIGPIPTDVETVCAFRIKGRVGRDDMAAMARYVDTRFQQHETVSMLLIFAPYGGAEAGAGWDPQSMKTQLASLAKVDKYAVVGAPDGAATMIETMDAIIPVNARTFDTEAEGWAFVGAPITFFHMEGAQWHRPISKATAAATACRSPRSSPAPSSRLR